MTLLITTAELERLIKKKGNIRIIDTRPFLDYIRGHIPNAINIELMQFHWSDTSKSGLKEFTNQSCKLFSNFGINRKMYLIFYDNISGPSAARGVWLSLYLSHQRVAMLNGGFEKWKREERVVSKETQKMCYRLYKSKPNPSVLISAQGLKSKLECDKNIQIVDSRTAEEFSGEHVRACRGGHVPLSTNIDWSTNLKNGSFRSELELKKMYRNFSKKKEIFTYCQGGYRAANSFVILREIGFKKVKMYLGSWNEWGNDYSLPIDN